jgi:HCOMODA/2-hydroxy-3-carboxy-muconic semialdehyde decarboxylase
MMPDIIDDLVAANRILAHFDVVDAYGHVSARDPQNPKQFFLSRSRSPELVDRDDIVTYGLDGEPAVAGEKRPGYLERYIHAGIYAARPDVHAVVHSHAEDVVPFGVTKQPLVPVIHSSCDIGLTVPVWDIREKFGDRTNMLVTNMDQGNHLAQRLGPNTVVLMRGHGFACGGDSLYQAVKIAVYLPRNAYVLTTALRFGEPVHLSQGEVEAMTSMDPTAPAARRAWEYWCSKAGVPTQRL